MQKGAELTEWPIAFNIRTPPPPPPPTPRLRTYSEDRLKLHLPLKTSIQYGLTLEEYGSVPLKNFVNIKASPSKNTTFFHSTPKEILIVITYTWRILWFNRGWGVGILNAIAQWHPSYKNQNSSYRDNFQ